MIELTEEQKEIISQMDEETKQKLNDMIYRFIFLWWLNNGN